MGLGIYVAVVADAERLCLVEDIIGLESDSCLALEYLHRDICIPDILRVMTGRIAVIPVIVHVCLDGEA